MLLEYLQRLNSYRIGAHVNQNGITTDPEDGEIQYIYTDPEDGTPQQILIDTEDL